MSQQFHLFSLKPWGIDITLDIKSLVLDSRQISVGDCFVAINGHHLDGRQYIAKAIALGANAILKDADNACEHGEIDYVDGVVVVSFYELNQQLSSISDAFFHSPSTFLNLIAVTGTNGKSTITQLIANWLTLLGKRAGVMGTIGNGLFSQLSVAENTTGSAIDVQREIARQVAAGAELCAMEVSSHGLIQGRVNKLDFDVALFTNLTRDHLDYHGDMASYAQAKKTLFDMTIPHRIFNIDDDIGKQWLLEWPQATAFSVSQKPDFHLGHYIYCDSVKFDDHGFTALLKSSWGEGILQCGLIGEFNVSNVLAALVSLLELGYSFTELLAVAPELTPVCGRMELFHARDSAAFIVDYAHTPDALEKALQALRVHCKGQLWCIYGCGGDRDKGKRPLMARVAEQFADHAVITDDNPRTEPSSLIVQDIIAGLTVPEQARVIHDRASAIRWVLQQSQPQDIVLVAGKGHEDYQILGQEKRHYSDRDTIKELLENVT